MTWIEVAIAASALAAYLVLLRRPKMNRFEVSVVIPVRVWAASGRIADSCYTLKYLTLARDREAALVHARRTNPLGAFFEAHEVPVSSG